MTDAAALLGREVPCPLCSRPVMIIATSLHPQTGIALGAMLDEHFIPSPLHSQMTSIFGAWGELMARCPMSGAEVRARGG